MPYNLLVASSNDAARIRFEGNSLPPDRYRVRMTLQGEDLSAYAYEGYLDYTVTIATEALTGAEQAAVDATLDFPPVIANDFPDVLLNHQ